MGDDLRHQPPSPPTRTTSIVSYKVAVTGEQQLTGSTPERGPSSTVDFSIPIAHECLPKDGAAKRVELTLRVVLGTEEGAGWKVVWAGVDNQSDRESPAHEFRDEAEHPVSPGQHEGEQRSDH